ncbi:MAG: hypothetical protein J6Y00_02650 [Paludibacteraceae bacterium]|nr:hypothetical protein [Paludibacteraceae bacterium]
MIIDWNKLLKTEEGERAVFEQFCRHIILRYFNDCGIEDYNYNTPGAESYILITKSTDYHGVALNAGDVVGWQAKYWKGKDPNNSPLGKGHRDELVAGFTKAVECKGEKLKLWILCTPGNFDQNAYTTLKEQLEIVSSNCLIDPWSKGEFEALYLNEQDKYNGIFHYYFDGNFLGKRTIDSITKDTLEKLRNKYDVDLHVPSEMERQLLTVVDSEAAMQTLRKKIEQVVDGIRDDMKHHGMLKKDGYTHTQFTDRYFQLYDEEQKNRVALADALAPYLEKEDLLEHVQVILQIVNQFIEQRGHNIDEINKELRTIIQKSENHEMSASTSFYFEGHRDRIYEIDKLICRQQPGILNLDQTLRLLLKKIHSIFAEPGYGKTHFACSVAMNLLQRKPSLPVLFLQGRDFGKEKSLADIMAKKLNIASDTDMDSIMDMLDFMGERYKCRMPIIIDGLNEADPYTKRWKDDLVEVERRIQERSHLLLITTCRSQKDYISVIYGPDKVDEIENSYELSGIEPNEVKMAVKKYFAEYDIRPNPHPNLSEFQHPLLLKIFCQTNKGKHDFDITGTSLTESMMKYSKQMIEAVANKEHPDFEMRAYEIQKGLRNYARAIWESNKRDMPYVPDFYEKFDQNEYARGIVDEGCCTTEMEGTESYVHFTYDMIAGYHIAEQIIATHAEKADFISYVTEQQAKLFGEERHTYGQDIVKSLVFLVPEKYGEQWCALMPSMETITAMFENLDGVLASLTGIETLRTIITSKAKDAGIKEQLCKNIYRRVCVEHNLSHFREFLPLFAAMQPIEIDQYWNNRFVTYPQMQEMQGALHDDYMLETYEWDDIISCNIVMCGIMDREFREIYHKQLFAHTMRHFDDVSPDVFAKGLRIPDAFMFESVVTVLTGIGLRAEEKARYETVVELLEDYMREYTSNCVLLLDALETLYSYGAYRWGVAHDRTILSKNKTEKWKIVKCREVDTFGLFDYDFDKFNIRPLYSASYSSNFTIKQLSEQKVYGMLLTRCRQNGYDEEICAKLNKEAYEKASYRSSKHIGFGEKYGRFALMELYGWLILNSYINPVYKDTFRTELFDVDPSMPYFPKKCSLVSRSLMPKNRDDLGEWIMKDDIKVMKELFINQLPGYEGEWVMMHGRLKQEISDKYANYYISGHVELAKEKMSDKTIAKLEVVDSIDTDHTYGAEIGWRLLESREKDEYWDEERRLLGYYGFSSWSGSRYRYRNFEYLRTKWAVRFGLRFDVNTMIYYDQDGKEASAYFVNDSDLFFYFRKDIVDTILKETKSCLRFHIYERRVISADIPKERDVYPKKFEQRERDVIYRIEK